MSLDCIEHTQKGDRAGYGKTKVNQRQMTLHRAVFLRTYGYLPEVVMHTCDNPRCINPAHLVAGTQSENLKDCVAKGRHVCNLPKGQLEDGVVRAIRDSKDKQSVIAERFGVDQAMVSRIKSGKAYRSVP